MEISLYPVVDFLTLNIIFSLKHNFISISLYFNFGTHVLILRPLDCVNYFLQLVVTPFLHKVFFCDLCPHKGFSEVGALYLRVLALFLYAVRVFPRLALILSTKRVHLPFSALRLCQLHYCLTISK